MTFGPDDEENPPGFYNTVSHPSPGSSLPAPPGPMLRRVAPLLGLVLLVVGIALLGYFVRQLVTDPPPPTTSRSFAIGRYVGALAIPAPFIAIGYVLLRHGGDAPRRVLRRGRHARDLR